MKKEGRELDSCEQDWRPRRHGHVEFTAFNAIFDKMIQLLLHSKVAKAESYLIGGYHSEWLELTYYTETLLWTWDIGKLLLTFCKAPSQDVNVFFEQPLLSTIIQLNDDSILFFFLSWRVLSCFALYTLTQQESRKFWIK